ncbi:MAG: thiol:disulfide interchange protein DsbA/DsbL [Xanthomonadaceae bacterium]|nr:thiol:disulfide interchange protein DsbA/DsbL [Xanthomonadaceae bacterium]
MLRFVLSLAFLILPLSACGQTSPPAQAQAQAGETYELVSKPGPWLPEKGKIEVVEYFSYTCSHCAQFHPMIEAWKKNLPKDVVFRYLPNAYDVEFSYSRAFFAAESAGALAKIHGDLFAAIHEDGRVPRNNATIDELAAYFAQHGLNREKMSAAMRSTAVTEQMKRAKQFVIDKGLGGTPMLVVAGKYVIQGETYREYIENLDKVIAMERAKRAAPKAATPKPAAKTTP